MTGALAASAWRPRGVTDGHDASSTVALADDPGAVWPADWEISGLAFGEWRWAAEVYGLDLTGRGDAPVDVVLATPLGRFRGSAVVVGWHAPRPGARVTALDGHGHLERAE